MKNIFVMISMFIMLSPLSNNAQSVWQAMIAGKSSGTISVKELLDAGKLSAADDRCLLITSFRFTAYAKNRNPIEFDSGNDSLTAPMIRILPTLPAGTKIYFEYIRSKDVRGAQPALAPMSFTLQ